MAGIPAGVGIGKLFETAFGAVRRDPAAGQQLRDWGIWQQPTPDILDEAIIMRQLQTKQRLARMGRQSTFLTGPQGLGGPSSEIARSFLMAAWNDAQDRTAATGFSHYPTLAPPPPAPRFAAPEGVPTEAEPQW